jgi:hypothetical protein
MELDVLCVGVANDRETDRLVMGGPGFSYDEYLIAVKLAATNIDEH